MKFVGYYNGEIAELEELKIPMLDRSVFFGDGCYDMFTFRNRRGFAMRDHLNRFYNSCRMLDIRPRFELEELALEIQKCLDLADSGCGIFYIQASRGTMYRSFAYHKDPAEMSPVSNLIMFTSPSELEPEGKVYHLKTHEDTRFLHCNIKTTNLIPAVMYSQRSWEEGCQESILHRNGVVTECGHSNVVLLKDGALWAHPQDNYILPGVTMNHLLMLAPSLGIETRIRAFTLDELRAADEVLITSTGLPVIRGVSLDGQPVGGKAPELLRKVQEAYREFYAANISRDSILDEANY